jgi:hypothetical protein
VPLVAGSDARVVSPTFTDLDELPAACDAAPTLAVSSLLGRTLTAPTVSAVPGESGRYRATLAATTHLATLDRLTLTWSGAVGGAARTLTQVVDVAGGCFVPTEVLASTRTVPESASTLDAVRAWRDVFERLAERARGVAFVPRLAVEDMPVSDRPTALLSHVRPRALLAVWVDGVAADVADWTMHPSGVVEGSFVSPTRFAYSRGHDEPPGALVVACRDYVRSKLLADTSDHNRNVLSFTDRVSGETYRFGTADWAAGRWTGLTSVDELIASVPDERIPGLA